MEQAAFGRCIHKCGLSYRSIRSDVFHNMMSVFLKERTVSVGGQNRIEKKDFVARRWSDNNSGVSFFRFEYVMKQRRGTPSV